MRNVMWALMGVMSLSSAAWAGTTVSYSFSQTGFAGGGSISGLFRGTDLDNDGQLYSVGGLGVALGLPGGNEVDYIEVTLTGFNTSSPLTLIYDASVADVNDPSNFFMGFSYNLDGGSFGDDPDEGLSLSFFAPSTNYLMGAAFSSFWNPVPISNPVYDVCGSGGICAGVLQFAPNPNDPSGVDIEYASYSRELITVTAVPLPGAVWLLLSGIGAMGMLQRRRRAG